MIGMLRGTVWEVQQERLIIDVQGVGYILTVPSGLLAKAQSGQEILVYTHLIPREDELSLYGFSSQEEKQMFLDMLTVSGIGPKAAIAILSTFGSVQVQTAIANENVTALTKVPGIGKKTAQRLVLELKEKFKERAVSLPGSEPSVLQDMSEALETLLALGFSHDEAQKALSQALQGRDTLPTEEQVKQALRLLAKNS